MHHYKFPILNRNTIPQGKPMGKVGSEFSSHAGINLQAFLLLPADKQQQQIIHFAGRPNADKADGPLMKLFEAMKEKQQYQNITQCLTWLQGSELENRSTLTDKLFRQAFPKDQKIFFGMNEGTRVEFSIAQVNYGGMIRSAFNPSTLKFIDQVQTLAEKNSKIAEHCAY